jgi:hypothetical protein
MTQDPIAFISELDEYRVQKIALEEAVRQLRYRSIMPYITLVRPGDVATDSNKTVPPSADVTVWADTLVSILAIAKENNLSIPDISLGPQ